MGRGQFKEQIRISPKALQRIGGNRPSMKILIGLYLEVMFFVYMPNELCHIRQV